MSPITTHVLDTALGKPAVGLHIELSRMDHGQWQLVGDGLTNDDGRIADLMPEGSLVAGTYRMLFYTGPYLDKAHGGGFYPEAPIIFVVNAGQEGQHFHVPLLLNPYGYSTYRGS